MRNENPERLMPVVDEFVQAVGEGNAGFIEACLNYEGRAPAIAVWCARLLLDAERVNGQHTEHLAALGRHASGLGREVARLRLELADKESRVAEWRQILTARDKARERREEAE